MATQTTSASDASINSSAGCTPPILAASFAFVHPARRFSKRSAFPNKILGYLFVFFTLAVYAVIGVATRTAQLSEYYVAGRRVPAFYNGMATGADWMSAASFVGMAGSLFLSRL